MPKLGFSHGLVARSACLSAYASAEGYSLVDKRLFIPEKWFGNEYKERRKKYKYKGEQRTKIVLADTEQKPISSSTLAKNTNSFFWYRRKVSEGTKGPIVYEFTRRRVKLSAEGLPQKEV